MPESMEEPRAEILIVSPLSRAWRHMAEMLFPFDFGLWIRLGLVAWLATLWRGGGGFSFNFSRRQVGQRGGMRGIENLVKQAVAYIEGHAAMILAMGAVVLLIGFGLYAGLLYLRSRGVFMYLDAVYERSCEVAEGWRRAARPSWSYFLLQLALGTVKVCVGLGVMAAVLLAGWPALRAGELKGLPWGLVFLSGGVMLAVTIAIGIARWLLSSFVAPIMYVRGCSSTEAWREMRSLFRGHIGSVFLFFLMSLALGIAGATVGVAVACLTCCIGALPVVFHSIMQPYFLCVRAYAPYFLAQFNRAYEVRSLTERAGELAVEAVSAPAEQSMADEGTADDEARVVVCPHCGAEQRVPGDAKDAYECSECGGGFVVE